MTVLNFMEYSIDETVQQFTIYDCNTEENIFTGTIEECPDGFLDAEVESFDIIDKDMPMLTLNVISVTCGRVKARRNPSLIFYSFLTF